MGVRRVIRRYGIVMFSVLIIITFIADNFIKLPYYVFSPGDAVGVAQYVKVPAEKNFPHTGDVFLTTVLLTHAHPSDIVEAKLTPGNRIEKEKDVIGDFTPQEFLDLNDQAMDTSKQTAISIAMVRAGYSVTPTGEGALVEKVMDNAPAAGVLNVGDVITSINGASVKLASDVTAAIKGLAPGAKVTLDVRARDGATRSVEITVAPRPENEPGVYVGVLVSTYKAGLDTPFPVNVDSRDIGGPSAGLAFTLGLLDALTPGNLTGDQQVAVTGTIEADSSVGPVGGIVQKTAAVNKTKATLFLVPSDEYEDAKAHADKDLTVVQVNTVDEALAALAAHGGDVSGVPQVNRAA